jgi:hypothetical protein
VSKSLANVGQVMTAEQRKNLDEWVGRLKAAMPGQDPDAISDAMDKINDAASPLTEAQMDQVLTKTVKGKKLDEV